MSYEGDLRSELRRLCWGRGLHERGLAGRLGPQLGAVIGVPTAEPDASLHLRLRDELTELSAGLDDELRTAAELAHALGPRPGELLTTRTRSYATRIHCSERAARRRMDQAIDALARAAVTRFDPVVPAETGPGWRTRVFSALLRLDTPEIELYEKRTVVTTADIDRLVIEMDLPPVAGSSGLPPPITTGCRPARATSSASTIGCRGTGRSGTATRSSRSNRATTPNCGSGSRR
ncbi:hypothetical protein AB0M20_22675 [Actinoplanes sp. NPDC051633]|uniref:hypothetical protein n=1 Tax=Actinoplanes sp. NPDC051633 TaxID=3155670 RepID=UPI00342F8A2E